MTELGGSNPVRSTRQAGFCAAPSRPVGNSSVHAGVLSLTESRRWSFWGRNHPDLDTDLPARYQQEVIGVVVPHRSIYDSTDVEQATELLRRNLIQLRGSVYSAPATGSWRNLPAWSRR